MKFAEFDVLTIFEGLLHIDHLNRRHLPNDALFERYVRNLFPNRLIHHVPELRDYNVISVGRISKYFDHEMPHIVFDVVDRKTRIAYTFIVWQQTDKIELIKSHEHRAKT